ncbi:chain-length determining protein [Cernens ardua]|uniref:chain-length determining protein n=1 Tax=Cernens ardua TaxID=3402176 RepID=UPI003F98E460
MSEYSMLMLQDYMTSIDMLEYLVKHGDFREEYSRHGDFFGRLRDKNTPLDQLYSYFKRRVTAAIDPTAGVLRITVQAYTPQEAHKVAELMIKAGNEQLNRMNQRLASEQATFMEAQVQKLGNEYDAAQSKLVQYQNQHGLAAPSEALDSVNRIISGLQKQLASAEAQRSSLLTYQSPQASQIVMLDGQIRALEKEIQNQENKAARVSGGALNIVTSDYQTLQLHAQFARQSYSDALAALQNTQIQATRQLNLISTIQTPTFPDYPQDPRRIYNITVFTVMTIFAGLILNMLILIVRDHRD